MESLPIFRYPPIRFTYPILSPSSIWSENERTSSNIMCKLIRNGLDQVLFFDAKDVHSIKVLRDERGVFWLFYNGARDQLIKIYNGSRGIGVAISQDGVFFVKHPKNPLIRAGLFELESGIWKCSPLKVGEKFLIYYGAFSRKGASGIRLAYSSDGIHWIKCKKPILIPDNQESKEYVSTPAVTYDKDKKLFIMLYLLQPSNTINLAYSTDGVRWRKCKNNPVLQRASGWEEHSFAPFCLIKKDHTYFLFYEGKSSAKMPNWRIGVAYSHDLIHWERYPENPVLNPGPPGNFDDSSVSDPSVIIDNHFWRLYYGCRNKYGIGYGGLALFPLEPICYDYFRVKGIPLDGKTIATCGTDGVICEGWQKMLINISSNISLSVEIQTLHNGNWCCYDKLYIHSDKLTKYELLNMSNHHISGVKLKFVGSCNTKIVAKWVLTEPCSHHFLKKGRSCK
ncbi:MAG: hypothetical protein QXL73_05525 [Thermoplasmata archaeon]